MFLTPAEAGEIEVLVAGIEARTGVQVVTALVGKSDTYAELPWKAFALGTSLAALVTVLRRGRLGWLVMVSISTRRHKDTKISFF